jgi:mevalonate kinase
MKVLAPGKLILSGEHAVVYGHPALAMAVNRYVTVTATPQQAPNVSFDLSDLSYQRQLSLSTLDALKNRIKQKYHRFLGGEFKIRDVLQKPVELAQVALSLFFEMLNIKLTQGINIHVESTIPIGCGMGSSAATVLSIVHAIANHLDLKLTPEMFLRLGLEAENMQHGYSSGIDLKVSLYGGCLYIKNGEVHQREVPTMPLYLVNTGSPANTTGECVEAAASYFKTSQIGDDFAAVTDAMDKALQVGNVLSAQQLVHANHKLLVKIGVVPQAVQQFFSSVQNIGGAAKICGAGAISGDTAGMALIITEDEAALKELCAQYHYSLLPIIGESRGVHIV